MASFFNKRFILLCLIIILNLTKTDAQNGFYVSKGLSVVFFFNTVSKYATGITYTDFFEIRVYNAGTHLNGPNWQIVAWLEAPFDNSMDYEVVEIEATDPSIVGTSVTGPQLLSNAALPIINSTTVQAPGIPMIISISIRVGTNPAYRVTGYPNGYYANRLKFEIRFSP